jgi:hypothetical protein
MVSRKKCPPTKSESERYGKARLTMSPNHEPVIDDVRPRIPLSTRYTRPPRRPLLPFYFRVPPARSPEAFGTSIVPRQGTVKD